MIHTLCESRQWHGWKQAGEAAPDQVQTDGGGRGSNDGREVVPSKLR